MINVTLVLGYIYVNNKYCISLDQTDYIYIACSINNLIVFLVLNSNNAIKLNFEYVWN